VPVLIQVVLFFQLPPECRSYTAVKTAAARKGTMAAAGIVHPLSVAAVATVLLFANVS
jgi:hypothetical protein